MKRTATFCFAVMLLVFARGASAASKPPALLHSGWLVYWDMDRGEKTIQDLHGSLDEICLFAYNFNNEGHLIPGGDSFATPLALLKGRQIAGRPRVWVTVVNDQVGKEPVLFKDPAVVHHALADPAARANHLQELLDLSKGADGLEIDYENLDVADRSLFSQFVSELAAQIHARGQLLSIVLEPRTEKQEKTEGPGAMDWTELGKSADRVRVMAYFLHYSGGDAGPTAPPAWVSEILAFALARIPKSKIDVAFCLDGIDWPSKGSGAELSFDALEDRRLAHKAPRRRSAHGEPPHYAYMEGKDIHEVWYEDADSLKEKLSRVQAAGLRRVSYWRLGDGDPNFWKWLSVQKGSPKPKK